MKGKKIFCISESDAIWNELANIWQKSQDVSIYVDYIYKHYPVKVDEDGETEEILDIIEAEGKGFVITFCDAIEESITVYSVSDYQRRKARARQQAIDWQYETANKSMSWQECADDSQRFERLGKRFGLIREFRENGIL